VQPVREIPTYRDRRRKYALQHPAEELRPSSGSILRGCRPAPLSWSLRAKAAFIPLGRKRDVASLCSNRAGPPMTVWLGRRRPTAVNSPGESRRNTVLSSVRTSKLDTAP